ncbi:asparaginase [Bifidobacterium mongoliense]|nr:asparaginase [Bifidobacterium mongoliense]
MMRADGDAAFAGLSGRGARRSASASKDLTDLPPVAVGALGGTIAMSAPRQGATGAVPSLDAEGLLDMVPRLRSVADFRVRNISATGSASLSFDDLLNALDFAKEQAESGVAGIVLAHGTDTLEESAYFLDLLWDRPEPIVFTGAMNTESSITQDGPQNIVDSVQTVLANSMRGMGVLVCLAGQVHLAHTVVKTNSTDLATFQSPDWGPVARIVEGNVHAAWRPAHRRMVLATPERPYKPYIPVVETGLGNEGRTLAALAGGDTTPDAIVLAASGAGHLSSSCADVAAGIVADGTPVVFATHTGSGSTFRRTYGYAGGEMVLIRKGLIPAGFLTARQSRILLGVLVANHADIAAVKRAFRHEGQW